MAHARALPTAVSLDDLPVDALALLAAFLSPIELFRLSHATPYLLRALSSDALWRDMETVTLQPQQTGNEELHETASAPARRWFAPMRDPSRSVSVKEDVLRHRSLLFTGERMDGDGTIAHVPSQHHAFAFNNAAFQRPPQPRSASKSAESHPNPPSSRDHRRRLFSRQRHVAPSLSSEFSFELWFAVSSVAAKHEAAQRQGGVLFGAQSKPFMTPATSFFYQQFVLVDPSLTLFCSLRKSDDKKVPLVVLQPDTWYHLALVNTAEREVVYLNGRVVSAVDGPLSAFFWSQFAHCQIGTGLARCRWTVSPLDRGAPVAAAAANNAQRSSTVGWYNFHGVVDTFRAYDRALVEAEVLKLAKCHDGAAAGCVNATAHSVFSMRKKLFTLRDGASTTFRYVRCTRPQDGKFERL